MTELQSKLERYEGKAAKCREMAEQAEQGPEREFFQILAGYYGKLARDFQQAIARREAREHEDAVHST